MVTLIFSLHQWGHDEGLSTKAGLPNQPSISILRITSHILKSYEFGEFGGGDSVCFMTPIVHPFRLVPRENLRGFVAMRFQWDVSGRIY